MPATLPEPARSHRRGGIDSIFSRTVVSDNEIAMPDMFNLRVVLGLKVFGWFSAVMALILGVGVLFGWAAGLPAAVTVQPGLAAMAPVTAGCFVISGSSLVAWKLGRPRLARGLAALLLAIGLTVVAGYVSVGRDLLNPLIGDRLASPSGVLVGLTAPASACGFLLLGAVLAALGENTRPGRLVVLLCGAAGLLLSGLALLGYAYGVEGLYAVRFYRTVALHTATGLFLLYLGCLIHKPELGWAAVLASARPSGSATRVQLLLTVLLPLTAGTLLLHAQRRGEIAPSFAIAALVVVSSIPQIARIFFDGRMLDRLDMDLRGAAERQRQLSEELEERVQARTAALQRTEDALRQSQKMEAVGQLTGGLAHDFNNLLTGITGSLELLQSRVSQGRLTGIDRYVQTALGAAGRAASLTHRLLAFSRRQTLDPKPIDINALVAGLDELLQRTIGPQVTLRTTLAPGLWVTLLDPSQIENALLNLAINARDAMPDGGLLTIETRNETLVSGGAEDLPCGQYVSLSVGDTGAGMTAETMRRAFDPFFTTKPIGEGTGLGLSMVHGFVQQSGGRVCITSEIGQGTCVRIILPRHCGQMADLAGAAPLPAAAGDGQGRTVLVVDDEPSVRMLICDVLNDLGYTVIEAEDGRGGLEILRSGRRVDLLISDVGLPGGMNGRQMADAGRVLRPGLKVLFITGYAETAALGDGNLGGGMQVLTKPFAMGTLAERVGALV